MLRRIWKNAVWLIMAFVMLVLGYLLDYTFVKRDFASSFLSTVEENIKTESASLSRSLQELIETIEKKDTISFASLSDLSLDYPAFVFLDSNLVYWSDNKFDIDYTNVNDYFVEKCFEKKKSIYIARKKFLTKQRNDYEIIMLFPLYRHLEIDNDYISPSYNERIFPRTAAKLSIGVDEWRDEERGLRVVNDFNKFLFRLQIGERIQLSPGEQSLLFAAYSLAILFFLVQLRQWIRRFSQHNSPHSGFIALIMGLLLLRGLMVYFHFPGHFLEIDLFSSKGFYANEANSTVGDLLLNVACLFVITLYLFQNYRKIVGYRDVRQRGQGVKLSLVTLFLFVSVLTINYLHSILENIYFNSHASIDISVDLTIDSFKMVCFLIFVLSAVTFFLISHIALKLLGHLCVDRLQALLAIGLALMAYLALGFTGLRFSWIITALCAFYFSFCHFFSLSSKLMVSDLKSFSYYLTTATMVALLGSLSIYSFHEVKDEDNKKSYVQKLLIENDVIGEYLIGDEVTNKIKKSRLVEMALSPQMPFATKNRDLATSKIKREFLGSHFDQYDIKVSYYDQFGKNVLNNSDLDSLAALNELPEYKTDYKNLFFIHDKEKKTKSYYCRVSVEKDDDKLGTVVLELNLKKFIASSLYPKLLLDKKFSTSLVEEKYSYAVYKSKSLGYAYGSFLYPEALPVKKEAGDTSSIVLFSDNGYNHILAENAAKNESIIVSSPTYSFKSLFANFSLQFLMLIAMVFLFNQGISYFLTSEKLKNTLASRIQLYLNLVYFIPLVIITIIIGGIINTMNEKDIASSFLEKAAVISSNVRPQIVAYSEFRISKDELQEQVARLANLTDTDVNLFRPNGALLTSSQPNFFELSLLSRLVHPSVMEQFEGNKKRSLLVNKEIGSLQYKSAYLAVQAEDKNKLLAIIEIPFFESEFKYEDQILDAVSSILIIFTLLFVALLVIVYFISRQLTYPLSLIRQKIKGTTLDRQNDPLDYKSDDEIGLLVGEYNKMLLKLEENKQQLARSEKESAWREMAKQVAHEIKNPLTPMKLTLQQLQRVLKSDEKAPFVSKALDSMLRQVDTLSDIATSFSAFAKMPLPEREEFDIALVLKEIVALYENDKGIRISTAIDEGVFWVQSDRKLMGRVFTNLILNGIQAVQADRMPHIFVALQRLNEEELQIEIRDNGVGISDEIKNKVFLPNFSTKFSGSGIGLAIAKRGIEHFGGTIWFETEEGTGTSFYIKMTLLKA